MRSMIKRVKVPDGCKINGVRGNSPRVTTKLGVRTQRLPCALRDDSQVAGSMPG